ncbi:type VI secretion system tip protein TssI/VgrG [Variovorax sp. 679]|jgi:type VI secretion system secreted protein VgrG|uniref:type VI secretion system Vgr family protein n=1 Tax=unclassified Variovorax TaxID=663243 RepID=UPI0026C258CB
MNMREGFTQHAAFLTVRTTLGPDDLLLDTFQATEGLSQLFACSLTMRSSEDALKAADLIGTSATVTLQRPEKEARFFNGIVSRFTYMGSSNDFATYTLELVPRMWLLTLGRDRVIYQDKTAPEIVQSVLTEFGVSFSAQLNGSYDKRVYCVRYDETAFDFVSRLMEEEGIFYFFTFTDSEHTLVLADSNSAWQPCPHAGKLLMRSGDEGHTHPHAITRFESDTRLVTKSHTVDDYDFLMPATSLLKQTEGAVGRGADYEYPSRVALASGSARARIRLEGHHAASRCGRGDSHCHYLTPGTTFTLEEHPRGDLNAQYVVHSVRHHAELEHYGNSFETLPPDLPFRPPLVAPRPVVAGNHTATVVGPAGEEIWTDEHGRIKVQFPWDRLGKKDDKSSCWIRVSQMWAGEGWGALFLPRVGQEVVISYVDGDPDRPLVSGSVYNGTHATPVALPGSSSQSTIRSNSTKGGGGFNEMRFEDKKGSEELYMHAQKDMRVEIENDLGTTVIAGNETHTVTKGNRTVKVDTGNEIHSVKGTRALDVTGNETHDNKANFTQTVTGNYELKVTGNLVIDVTGTLLIKSAQTLDLKAGTDLGANAAINFKAEAGVALSAKGGASLSTEAPSISSKASGMNAVEGGGMVTLKGGLVKIN